jgi:hypothetical protein
MDKQIKETGHVARVDIKPRLDSLIIELCSAERQEGYHICKVLESKECRSANLLIEECVKEMAF